MSDSVDINSKQGMQDRTILETMYTSGLRVSELINLELNNIFFEDGFLRFSERVQKKE
jgi:integrase/recombinase XerD